MIVPAQEQITSGFTSIVMAVLMLIVTPQFNGKIVPANKGAAQLVIRARRLDSVLLLLLPCGRVEGCSARLNSGVRCLAVCLAEFFTENPDPGVNFSRNYSF